MIFFGLRKKNRNGQIKKGTAFLKSHLELSESYIFTLNVSNAMGYF